MRQAMPRARGGRFGGLRAALERLDRLPPRRALLLGAGVGVGGGVLLWTPGGAVGLAGATLLLCGGAALLAMAEPLADVAVAPEDPLPMEALPGGAREGHPQGAAVGRGARLWQRGAELKAAA